MHFQDSLLCKWKQGEKRKPLGRTTAVFSLVLGFILAQTHCVHKDTARYVSSYSKPFKLLLKEQTNCPPKSGNFTDNNFNLSK